MPKAHRRWRATPQFAFPRPEMSPEGDQGIGGKLYLQLKKAHSMPKDERLGSLASALQKESKKFETTYLWLEKHMPPSFFEQVDEESLMIIVHTLMGFDLQEYFSQIDLKHSAFALCLDTPDADLRILSNFQMAGIKNYRAFVSNAPPPFAGVTALLRIAVIFFSTFSEEKKKESIPNEKQQEILTLVKQRNPDITDSDFHKLIQNIDQRFLRSLTQDRLVVALDMFYYAKTRDPCQLEVRYNKDWKEKKDTPSMQIVLAWRNVPKYNFLYRLAKCIYRHKLSITKLNATYIDPYSTHSVLMMSIGLHGINGEAAWEAADIPDFLQEFVTVKYFEGQPNIEAVFVDTGLLSGNLGNFVKTMVSFIHQALVHTDLNMYSFGHVEEALSRHPELTVQLCKAFEAKFHPEKHNLKDYQKLRATFLDLIEHLDTGQAINDLRRKNILQQGMNFIDFTLKTNFYRANKTALSFRLDPAYLDHLPFDRREKFPELPFAIFFMKGMHFIGFHIRFKDLSRGGLRTVLPDRMESYLIERNNIFSECYALAYTQQKKNKDIPEGGAKGIILLKPYEVLLREEEIYKNELQNADIPNEQIAERLESFRKEQKLEFLYQSQRSYIESFVTLLNCEPDGTLKAKSIVDYWKKPEYIYLGPDENMHDVMINWIAGYSLYYGYKPGGAFMSSKPKAGINHKEYGVTSLGVNVYMEETLKFMGIDPYKQPFTIKMSGGPDGDVAGNQILNLSLFYPKTAKLLALIDVSGTIFDPQGLDLTIMAQLFREAKPISAYPPEKLSDGGFLLDVRTKREQTAYTQQTLCWRKKDGKLEKDWLSGNEMNYLLRHNVHQVKSDIFVPGGGRPRTLNENNYKDFLDDTGRPTSKAIVEGANLYLTQPARRSLEKLGVLIIKDSSANKGGVICSSFEVLCGLTLTEEEFLKEKPILMKQILLIIQNRAKDEADLMLRTHAQTKEYLTDISEKVSERINHFTYELLDYFQTQTLSNDPKDPLIRCLLNYCPALLRTKYEQRVLSEIPDIHKKAIIACYIAQKVVYKRGLDWSPKIIDVLPLIVEDPILMQP
jgi:glutamate dehydrogenase